MNLSPGTSAKLSFAAFICIGLASTFLGLHFREQTAHVEERARTAAQAEQGTAADVKALSSLLRLSTAAAALVDVQAAAEKALMGAASRHGVVLQGPPVFALQSGHPVDFVQGASIVRTSTTTVTGTYTSLPGLTAYLATLQGIAVSLEAFRVRGTQFELTVRAWGA